MTHGIVMTTAQLGNNQLKMEIHKLIIICC